MAVSTTAVNATCTLGRVKVWPICQSQNYDITALCVSNEKKARAYHVYRWLQGKIMLQLINWSVIEVIYMWHWPDSDFDLFLIISSSSQLSRCQAAVAMFFKFAPSVKCAMKLVNIALYVPFHWYFLSLLYVKCTCQKRIESKNSLSKNIFIAVNVKL